MLSPLETALIALLLVVLMFGMGATLTWERFQAVAREPKAFLIGTASQFGFLPLLAYGLAKGLSLPAQAALGLVVMGTCPGGTTSNLFAHLAKADVGLATLAYRWLDRRAGAANRLATLGSVPLGLCLTCLLGVSLSACAGDAAPKGAHQPSATNPSTAGESDSASHGDSATSASDGTSASASRDAGSTSAPSKSDAGGAEEPPLPTVTGSVTYYQDVKPFMDAKCVRCHVAGTVAPFSLDTYALAKEHGTIGKAAVMSGSMPPWLFKDGCNEYKGNFSLTPLEKATLYAWVDQGMPEGDSTKPGAKLDIGEVGLSRVDVSLQIPELYTSKQQPDEYRCFPVAWPSKYTKDVFMTGYRAVPSNPRVVHHVEVYYIPKAQVATVMSKDAADPGPGYTCFGGPGAGNGTVGGWAPGSPGYDYPPNVGIKIEAGSVMVIQVHYNTQTAGQAEPDQSKVEFKVDENVVEGGYDFWLNLAWAAGGMNIPAGKSDVAFDWTADPTSLNSASVSAGGFGGSGSGKPIMLYTAGIHMHNLGTTGYMHLKRKDGSRECIVELRDWDFHWQGGVRLQKPIAINPGDVIEMECRYDNSQANQPVYQGKQQAPRNVNWGENTTDEMCLGILLWGQQ